MLKLKQQIPSVSRATFSPPTNEVCEGYVFTGICLSMVGVSQSLSRRRGEVSVWGGSLSRVGCLCPGGLCPGGQVVSFQRVSDREIPRTVTCGRYASYLNAFLFVVILLWHDNKSTAKRDFIDHFFSLRSNSIGSDQTTQTKGWQVTTSRAPTYRMCASTSGTRPSWAN